MGSSNRDYMQDEYQTREPSWGHDVPTTKWLVIITVVVFFLQSLLTHGIEFRDQNIPSVAGLEAPTVVGSRVNVIPVAAQRFSPQVSYVTEWLSLDSERVLRGQIWRLVTFVFCHREPWGLVFNMLAVWYLGSALERMYGSRELLWFYLASALVCGLTFTAFGLKLYLPFPLMGAGACVMALLTLYATHFPRQEILFFWVLPMQIRVLLWIYVAVDLYGILQASNGLTSWATVAYMAELWGVAFGYLYRRMKWRFDGMTGIFDFRGIQKSLRRASTARTLKVFQPDPISNLDEQVDAILAKIHEHGSESLTERERSILQRASEQAKNRL